MENIISRTSKIYANNKVGKLNFSASFF